MDDLIQWWFSLSCEQAKSDCGILQQQEKQQKCMSFVLVMMFS